jgi:hypothetical protein
MQLSDATLVCLIGLLAPGCGAYADAAREDGGGTDEFDSRLLFYVGAELHETIRQDAVEEYRIEFETRPPWGDGAGGLVFPTRFEFRQDGQLLRDIEYVRKSHTPQGQVIAILRAARDARTGERELWLDLAFELSGQAQRLYRGQGRFYVLPGAHTSPDGGDGSGS